MNNAEEKWPVPEFDKSDEPHFLFIVTLPYCGSTAMANLVNTSSGTVTLQPQAEAQWLIPALRDKTRWDPDMEINMESIRAVWLNKFQQIKSTNPSAEVVIEKSPPNMVRLERLAALFKECSFVATNRNPYAQCSSALYRNHDVTKLSRQERLVFLERLANRWISRSQRLQVLALKLDMPLITYETFCKEPVALVQALKLPAGVDKSIDLNANIKVKDYPSQTIINQNEIQVSRLYTEELRLINSVLSPHEGLLSFYNYLPL